MELISAAARGKHDTGPQRRSWSGLGSCGAKWPVVMSALIVADDYPAMSSKLRIEWAHQGQPKSDTEINHVPKLSTMWSVLELDTFMQGDKSSVTQGIV
jgi:hypothetical protein